MQIQIDEFADAANALVVVGIVIPVRRFRR